MSSTIPFDAYKGAEPFIFVSYAHKDRDSVFPLILELHQQGYRIWYDEGIDPGNEWAVEIARALKNASQFLVFITPSSILSKNVKNEINFALNRDKGFIAVHLVETQLPDELDLRMGDIQAILKWRMSEEHFTRKMTGSLSSTLKRATSLVPDVRFYAADMLRVPPGCRVSEGAAAEPYSQSGCAQEVVHSASGMALRFIPPGTFTMGSPAGEAGRYDVEVQHRVSLTQGFYLGKYPVTQAQWEQMMGANPSRFKGVDLPVEQVSWDDCQTFLKKLGAGMRLPTEAEWEYACQAGTTSAFAGELGQMAWYDKNSGGEPHAVGQKQPNAWELYDMHGNVWEWCSDWYGAYPTGATTDPQGAQSSSYRVYRGGSWGSDACRCRSALRAFNDPSHAHRNLGFRVVLAAPVQ